MKASTAYRLLTSLITLGSFAWIGVADGATITVNTADNTDFSAGKMNLYKAITNASAGDTIAFNIPGSGPHYLQVPAAGFPLIYQKHNLTIDGYTQPGASPNSNPITGSNNAVIKIVIDGRAMGGRMMDYSLYNGTLTTSDPAIDNTSMSTERTGYGDTEWAMLGVYRSTNVMIKGLAFLGDDGASGLSYYGVAFAHDYGGDTTVKDRLAYDSGSTRGGHIAGCWFGVNPTNPTPAGVVKGSAAVAFFRHREASAPVVPAARPELPNEGIIIGVKPGSSNPRSEFNIFVGHSYALAGEAIRSRVSGNFFGVMPDGVTPYDVSIEAPGISEGNHFEIGRYSDTEPMIFGTDGDGVNDADEGNVLGPIADKGGAAIAVYSSSDKTYIVSGNRFGIASDGSRWTNSAAFLSEINVSAGSRLQLGSDLNGTSDAAEANHIYNNYPISSYGQSPSENPVRTVNFGNNIPNQNSWVSVRGNVLVNNGLTPYYYADIINPNGRLDLFTNFSWRFMDTNQAIIPQVSAASSISSIIGSCAGTNGGSYSNIFIDVYTLDPEGWANGALWMYTELNFTNGFPQGKALLGSFVDNGALDRDPAVGKFNFDASALNLTAGTRITVTANYSQDPAGTKNGRTFTSNFSNPVSLADALRISSATRAGNTLTITWSGGKAPFTLHKKTTIGGTWSALTSGITGNSATDTIGAGEAYYTVSGN